MPSRGVRTSARETAITLAAASMRVARHAADRSSSGRIRPVPSPRRRTRRRAVSGAAGTPSRILRRRGAAVRHRSRSGCSAVTRRAAKRAARRELGESLQPGEVRQREVSRDQRRRESRDPEEAQRHDIGEALRRAIVSKVLRVDVRAGDDDDQWRADGLEKRDQHVAPGNVNPLLPTVTRRRFVDLPRESPSAEKQPRDAERADGRQQERARRHRRHRRCVPRHGDDRQQRDARPARAARSTQELASARRPPGREPPSSRRRRAPRKALPTQSAEASLRARPRAGAAAKARMPTASRR